MNKALKTYNSLRMERWSDSKATKKTLKKYRQRAARRIGKALVSEV